MCIGFHVKSMYKLCESNVTFIYENTYTIKTNFIPHCCMKR